MKGLFSRYTIKSGREHLVQLLYSRDDELERTVRSLRAPVKRDGEPVLPA
jgi:hypothetical protein